MSNTEQPQNKMRWLGGTMSGDNDQVASSLFELLPATVSLDQAGEEKLALSRDYMAELWLRGISKQRFVQDSGITGFPVDPKIEGMSRQEVRGGHSPTYFSLFLTEREPVASADALKTLLTFRQQRMPEDYRSSFRLLFFVDIDTENEQYPMPYEAGLTPHAVCFDLSMGDVQKAFLDIEFACEQLSLFAQCKLRLGIGQFALQEYDGIGKGNLFTKRMLFDMGAEWLLFKNIQRRAGRFSWFWRRVAKLRDGKDN